MRQGIALYFYLGLGGWLWSGLDEKCVVPLQQTEFHDKVKFVLRENLYHYVGAECLYQLGHLENEA